MLKVWANRLLLLFHKNAQGLGQQIVVVVSQECSRSGPTDCCCCFTRMLKVWANRLLLLLHKNALLSPQIVVASQEYSSLTYFINTYIVAFFSCHAFSLHILHLYQPLLASLSEPLQFET